MASLKQMQGLLKWYTYPKYLEVWKLHYGEEEEMWVDGTFIGSHFAVPLHKLSEEEFEEHKLGRGQAYFDITTANNEGDKETLYRALFDGHIHELNLLLGHFSDKDGE